MSSWFSTYLPEDRGQRGNLFVKRLEDLEASVAKMKNDIRFYTPSAPMIGVSTSGNAVNVNGNERTTNLSLSSAEVSGSDETVSADAGDLDDSMDHSS